MSTPGDKPLLGAFKAFAAFGTGTAAQASPAKVQTQPSWCKLEWLDTLFCAAKLRAYFAIVAVLHIIDVSPYSRQWSIFLLALLSKPHACKAEALLNGLPPIGLHLGQNQSCLKAAYLPCLWFCFCRLGWMVLALPNCVGTAVC